MSIRKRALSLLLVLVMLLGVLPAGAAAAEVYQDVPTMRPCSATRAI